ncbi:transglycosylase SLT domain-containing protein [Actinomadura geliboluensis]|uniref:transglycosylase SLT domain-containing protein n=1 Tax=Actinomadura geliboluensis TaxID=882440 RepID=UPI003695A240
MAAAALMAGFPPNEVPRAVAVAKGESSFNPKSSNACCQGLWQIHRKAHADKIAKYGGVEKLNDPLVNAKLAYEIWKAAGGWCTHGSPPNCNPWQAYGVSNATGTWKGKLTEGAKALAEVKTRQNNGDTLAEMVNEGLDRSLGFDVPGPEDVPGLGELMDTAGAIAGLGKAVVEFANKIGAWVSDPHNWIRVAEVVGGSLLFMLGLRIAFNKQVNAVGKEVVKWVVPGGKAAKLAKGKI